MSTPVQFGPSAQPLIGHWHEPVANGRPCAILICPSWGMEYLRMYRGLRALAQRLAEAGFPVLRFDYSCTGDSAGEGIESSVESWLGDIAIAARELRDISGADRLCIFGTRLGSLLAQEAIAKGLVNVDACVLLDPPASGAAYALEARRLNEQLDGKKNSPRPGRAQLPPMTDDELLGHGWSAALARSVDQLPGLVPTASYRRLLLTSVDSPKGPEGLETLELPDPGYWQDFHRLYNAWAPGESLRLVTATLGTWLK